MKPTFRTGGAPDLDFVTSGIVAAGDGLVEFLVSGLVPGMSTERLLQAAVLDAGSPLNVSNAIIAEIGGRPSGLALAYPIEQFGITSDLMALIPRKRNFVLMFARDDVGSAWFRFPACQCRTTSTSSKSPARTM